MNGSGQQWEKYKLMDSAQEMLSSYLSSNPSQPTVGHQLSKKFYCAFTFSIHLIKSRGRCCCLNRKMQWTVSKKTQGMAIPVISTTYNHYLNIKYCYRWWLLPFAMIMIALQFKKKKKLESVKIKIYFIHGLGWKRRWTGYHLIFAMSLFLKELCNNFLECLQRPSGRLFHTHSSIFERWNWEV